MCTLVSINWSYVFFFITYYSTGYKSCMSYFAVCDPTSLLRRHRKRLHGYISKYKKKNENKCVPVCVKCGAEPDSSASHFQTFSFSAGTSTFGFESFSLRPFPWEASTSELSSSRPILRRGIDYRIVLINTIPWSRWCTDFRTLGSSSSRPFSAVASSSGSYSSRPFSHLLRQTDYILDQIQRWWIATSPKMF